MHIIFHLHTNNLALELSPHLCTFPVAHYFCLLIPVIRKYKWTADEKVNYMQCKNMPNANRESPDQTKHPPNLNREFCVNYVS